MRIVWAIGWVWLAIVLAACQTAPRAQVAAAPPAKEDVARLAQSIQALDARITRRDAARAATTALSVTEAARVAHLPLRPAEWNNVLINMRVKKWGLCWQWTERLGQALREESLPSLSVQWACAHRGSTLREHNAVLLTPRATPAFSRGLILDPWRRSGQLVWVRADEDIYPWQPDPGAGARWLNH